MPRHRRRVWNAGLTACLLAAVLSVRTLSQPARGRADAVEEATVAQLQQQPAALPA